MDKDQFVNQFITNLYEKIPEETLKIVKNELFLYIEDYDLSQRETAVGQYTGYLPGCYKIYFVSRKIEGLSERTLEQYNLYLDDFFFTVNKEFEEITANDIRVYLYQVQKQRNISDRTLDSRRAAIHAFFTWAADEGYIEKNPCRSIKKIKYQRKEREGLTSIELEKVRIACKTIREKALVEFLYSTGARVTEACNIKISDVSFEKEEVTLFGKGSKYRTSYLSAKSILYLKEYLNTRTDQSEYLFVSERKPHNGLKKEAIERVIRNLGKRSGIGRDLFPHLFRHTVATDMLRKDTPITDVQRMLGHANVNTTMVYAKTCDEDVKRNHRKSVA
jgi:site-specific recombinase XerD